MPKSSTGQLVGDDNPPLQFSLTSEQAYGRSHGVIKSVLNDFNDNNNTLGVSNIRLMAVYTG